MQVSNSEGILSFRVLVLSKSAAGCVSSLFGAPKPAISYGQTRSPWYAAQVIILRRLDQVPNLQPAQPVQTYREGRIECKCMLPRELWSRLHPARVVLRHAASQLIYYAAQASWIIRRGSMAKLPSQLHGRAAESTGSAAINAHLVPLTHVANNNF